MALQAGVAAPPAPALDRDLRKNGTAVRGEFPVGFTSNLLRIRIDGIDRAASEVTLNDPVRRFDVALPNRLRAGQVVEVSYFFGGVWSAWSNTVTVAGDPATDLDDEDTDPFKASAFLGGALDNFASQQFLSAIDETDRTAFRLAAGFEIEYRLLGASAADRQLWAFARLEYAPRSGEVTCGSKDQDPLTCVLAETTAQQAQLVGKALQHAHSFEGSYGLRYDLWTIQPTSPTPARVFITGQYGIVVIADSNKQQASLTLFGGGLRLPSGRFADSKVEVGVGKTELITKSFPRLKANGLLIFPSTPLRVFFRFDSETGNDVHSLITTMGVRLDVDRLFK